MKKAIKIIAPAGFLARSSLTELDRRSAKRSSLRANGFDLASHDRVTIELREIAARECLKASIEARDADDHEGAKSWAEHYAHQEWLANQTRERLDRMA